MEQIFNVFFLLVDFQMQEDGSDGNRSDGRHRIPVFGDPDGRSGRLFPLRRLVLHGQFLLLFRHSDHHRFRRFRRSPGTRLFFFFFLSHI